MLRQGFIQAPFGETSQTSEIPKNFSPGLMADLLYVLTSQQGSRGGLKSGKSHYM